ncbi:N-acetyllactosaminide beta-1,6-N-acetylglucosaminyl-transferase-like [Montipora foliosa]|uniref:N-acetyllactosaminide beta-1,6-N-acetylglucosaminyl-transferase-like n=1 Tax=Montipora foliosa TaxID=591990 RepID=UPI0035F1AC56
MDTPKEELTKSIPKGCKRRNTRRFVSFLCIFFVGTYIVCTPVCQYLKNNRKEPTTWSECERIISKNSWCFFSKIGNWFCAGKKPTETEVYSRYEEKGCNDVKEEFFPHPSPTQEEKDFPIAYAMVVFTNADLVEKVLQSIYMPQNVYCIHVDVKSSEAFRKAIRAMTACLDNVFLTDKTVDVIWPHVSILHAQINCLGDLMKSSVKWKYFMHVTGQEFPLYNNAEIVRALANLNGSNNIESYAVPINNWHRYMYSHRADKVEGGQFYARYSWRRTNVTKRPPPWGIRIKKGSNFVALTREAASYILYDKVAIDFLSWLNDTSSPDEAFYSSLHQHPGFPGGIYGSQPEWIMRAVSWEYTGDVCFGQWIREVCWLTTRDLNWVLGANFRKKIFVTKIPFDHRDDIVKCLALARSIRRYGQVLL